MNPVAKKYFKFLKIRMGYGLFIKGPPSISESFVTAIVGKGRRAYVEGDNIPLPNKFTLTITARYLHNIKIITRKEKGR